MSSLREWIRQCRKPRAHRCALNHKRFARRVGAGRQIGHMSVSDSALAGDAFIVVPLGSHAADRAAIAMADPVPG